MPTVKAPTVKAPTVKAPTVKAPTVKAPTVKAPTVKALPTAADILVELKTLGKESYKQTLLRHGIVEPVYGVSVENLKKIQKRVKKDYQLALELFESGVYDAMYLAGLIADEARMTKKDLQRWVEQASCDALCTYTVAGVTADGSHGWEMGLKWIDAKKPHIAAAGWAALAGVIATSPDEELNVPAIRQLVKRVEKEIHAASDRVRYNMNNFVISVAAYVEPLFDVALAAAERIGKVEVDMGDTACKVPFAPDYIRKIQARGSVGKKRKSARC